MPIENQSAYDHRVSTWPAVTGEFIRAGYEDARQNMPFHPDYDAWTEDFQDWYEQGRGLAAVIIGGGCKPFPWNSDVRTVLPSMIQAQYIYARHLVGAFFTEEEVSRSVQARRQNELAALLESPAKIMKTY
jgi:hypothetical protein